VDYLTSTIVSPGKLYLQQLAHLTPKLLIQNLPNQHAVWHFGECEYYCRGGSKCEQRHVFDTYVRDCVSARIRLDVQERAITRCCRWNCQHAVPGTSRGAPLRPSSLEIEVWGCEIAVETGIVLDGGLPLFLQSEVSLGVYLEVFCLGALSKCQPPGRFCLPLPWHCDSGASTVGSVHPCARQR